MKKIRNDYVIKRNIILIAVAVFLIFVPSYLFVFPCLYENDCKTRVYEDFREKMTDRVLSSNICIVKTTSQISGDTEYFTYSQGASGVIFDKQNNILYALTAYHVVSDYENADFVILPYGAVPYSEVDASIPISEYYRKFPSARVEYIDPTSDIAIISFSAGIEYGYLEPLPISSAALERNMRIAVISNPEGHRYVQTYGVILSDSPVEFIADNAETGNMVYQHSAYIAPGSSGSVAVNEKMEIVGVNLGGGTDFMDRFRYGAMVPCEKLKDIIEAWQIAKTPPLSSRSKV